jgi:hypothetical protein
MYTDARFRLNEKSCSRMLVQNVPAGGEDSVSPVSFHFGNLPVFLQQHLWVPKVCWLGWDNNGCAGAICEPSTFRRRNSELSYRDDDFEGAALFVYGVAINEQSRSKSDENRKVTLHSRCRGVDVAACPALGEGH